MTLSAVLNICSGELVSQPNISHVVGIKTNAKRIKREDLFIATNNADIKDAVQNGAYAVIFSGKCEILDEDVAFIRVENVAFILLAFFRYFFINANKPSFLLEEIEYEIAKSIQKDKKVFCVDTGNLMQMLELVSTEEAESFLFFEEILGKNVFCNFQKMSYTKNCITLLKTGLLRTSFIISGEVFNIEILRSFVENLMRVLNFFIENRISFNVKNIQLESFAVLRLDRLDNLSKNGEKILIFCSDELALKILKELKHARVKQNAKLGQIGEDYDFFIFNSNQKKAVLEKLMPKEYKQGTLFER